MRAWETRFGFPTPQRSEGRHRRYRPDEVDAIRRVLDARARGFSLEAAIDAARAAPPAPRSIFAAVRERRPDLAARTIGRRTMLALSHAIEDECCARAAEGVLLAAFQDEPAYDLARDRYRELARTARAAVVLAAFPTSRPGGDAPAEVAIDDRSPLAREWAVVCDAPGASACLVGWEQPPGRDGSRRFEAFWSVDPEIVRTAVVAGLALAADLAPQLQLPEPGLLADRPPEPIDPDRLAAISRRVIVALDAALETRPARRSAATPPTRSTRGGRAGS